MQKIIEGHVKLERIKTSVSHSIVHQKRKKVKNENLCRSRRFSCLFNYWLIGLQNWLRLLPWQYYMLRRLLYFKSIFLFLVKLFFEDISVSRTSSNEAYKYEK